MAASMDGRTRAAQHRLLQWSVRRIAQDHTRTVYSCLAHVAVVAATRGGGALELARSLGVGWEWCVNGTRARPARVCGSGQVIVTLTVWGSARNVVERR